MKLKRRKFIKATLLTIPAVGVAQTRLYGTPESVAPRSIGLASDRLLLPISRSGLPPEFWKDIQSISAAVIRIFDSEDAASRFHANPVGYMQEHGLDTSDRVMANGSFRLLTSLSDPGTKDYIRRKDYSGFLAKLRQNGVLNGFQSADLTRRIESGINSRRQEIQAMMNRRFSDTPSQREALLSALGDERHSLSEEDLSIASELLSMDMTGPLATFVLVVAIAAVLITVLAEVMVFTVVTAWVSVHGPELGISPPEVGLSPPMVAMLDPQVGEDMDRIGRISILSGDREILVRGMQEAVIAEMTAVVTAMQNSGLLSLSHEQSERIIEAMSTYAIKTTGL